jgi:hypothetical protein
MPFNGRCAHAAVLLAMAASAAACGKVSVGLLEDGPPKIDSAGGSGFVVTGGSAGSASISAAGAVGFAGTGGLGSAQAGFAGGAPCSDAFPVDDSIVPQCPASPPNDGDSCADAVENGICVWQTSLQSGALHGYYAAGCYTWLNGKVWWGVSHTQNEPFGAEDTECPTQPPSLGAACSTTVQKVCIYPFTYCECRTEIQGVWLCTDALVSQESPPIAVKRLCPAPGVDETKQVKDLTALDASTWCAWSSLFAHQGQSYLFAGSRRQFPNVADVPLCAAQLTVEQCVQNLGTQPCTATLAEVDDCLQTVLLGSRDDLEKSPFTRWVGHGCAPLLNNPTCTGIVVEPWHRDEKSEADQCVTPLK